MNNIASWVAVILSLGSAFWAVANPRDDIKSMRSDYDSRLADMKRDYDYRIIELNKTINQQFVTIAEFKEYITRKDKDTDRMEKAMDRFNNELVPRSEHAQHWTEQAASVLNLREGVSEIRKEFTGSWNIGKQLDNMQKEIDQIIRFQTANGTVQHVTVSPTPPQIPQGH